MTKGARCSLAAVAVAALRLSHAQEIEIEFEPLDASQKEFMSMLQTGTGPFAPPGKHHPHSTHGKEAQLDDVLTAMLSDLGPPPGLRGGPKGFPDGIEVLEIGPAFGPPPGKSAFPAGMFRDLFPGPIMTGVPQMHPMPFDEPDPHVQGLIKDLDQTFLHLMGNIQKASSNEHMPNACDPDIKKYCSGTNKKLHCLGAHAEEISETCRKDVGKSLPFRCSSSIDKFCDVLEDGILNCLGSHVQELPGECKDAVLATHHVISKANSQKASVVDVTSGAKLESKPSDVVTTPAPLPGAPHAQTAASELPMGMLDLLGKARSTMAAHDAASGAFRTRFMIAAMVVCVLAFAVYKSVGDARHHKQLMSRLMSGGENQGEAASLTKSDKGVEFAKKKATDLQAFGA